MKKIIWIYFIIGIFLLSGCSKETIKEKDIEKKENNIEKIEEREPIKNPISVGIYMRKNGLRSLTKEYRAPFILNKDVGVFSTFYTQEESISGDSIQKVWMEYFNTYENISSYKIGYRIEFETKNAGKVDKIILEPKDAESFYDYMQVYLYDDVHQLEGAFYTHIEEMKEDTLLTSIKLTGSTLTHEIVSPIILTAFTYEEKEEIELSQYKEENICKTFIYREE